LKYLEVCHWLAVICILSWY